MSMPPPPTLQSVQSLDYGLGTDPIRQGHIHPGEFHLEMTCCHKKYTKETLEKHVRAQRERGVTPNCPTCRKELDRAILEQLDLAPSLPPSLPPPLPQPIIPTSTVHRWAHSPLSPFSSTRATRFDDDDPILPLTSAMEATAASTTDLMLRIHSQYSSYSPDKEHSCLGVVEIENPDVDISSQTRKDVVVVIDLSVSMDDPVCEDSPFTRLDTVKRFFAAFIARLNPSDRVALVTFGNTARKVTRLMTMTDDNKREMQRIVRRLSTSGCTNIVSGVGYAARILQESREANPTRSIFLLSDGIHNKRGHHRSETERAALIRMRALTIPAGTVINSLGIGENHHGEFMRAVTNLSAGGLFSPVTEIINEEQLRERAAISLAALVNPIALNVILTATSEYVLEAPAPTESSPVADGFQINLNRTVAGITQKFPFKVALLPSVVPGPQEIVRVSLNYDTATEPVISKSELATLSVERREFIGPMIPDTICDQQNNRLTMLQAVTHAKEATNQEETRTILNSAIAAIRSSFTGRTEFCQQLIADLEALKETLNRATTNIFASQLAGITSAQTSQLPPTLMRTTSHTLATYSQTITGDGPEEHPSAREVMPPPRKRRRQKDRA